MPRNIPERKVYALEVKDHVSLDYVTANFKRSELSCPCCGKFNMDEPTLSFIQEIRVRSGIPMPINSAVRCKKHNDLVGGSPNSAHLEGFAIDVRIISNEARFKLMKAAIEANATGIGVYPSFMHIDRKPRKNNPIIWHKS